MMNSIGDAMVAPTTMERNELGSPCKGIGPLVWMCISREMWPRNQIHRTMLLLVQWFSRWRNPCKWMSCEQMVMKVQGHIVGSNQNLNLEQGAWLSSESKPSMLWPVESNKPVHNQLRLDYGPDIPNLKLDSWVGSGPKAMDKATTISNVTSIIQKLTQTWYHDPLHGKFEDILDKVPDACLDASKPPSSYTIIPRCMWYFYKRSLVSHSQKSSRFH